MNKIVISILTIGLVCSAYAGATGAGDNKTILGSSLDSPRLNNCTEDFEEDKLGNCSDNCIAVYNPSQLDTDGDDIGNACDGDIGAASDCIINYQDYLIVIAAMFSDPSSSNWNADADFNGDELVNLLDASIFSGMFLSAPGPSGLAECGA